MTRAPTGQLLSKLMADVRLLKWMAGVNIALSVATLGILLRTLS